MPETNLLLNTRLHSKTLVKTELIHEATFYNPVEAHLQYGLNLDIRTLSKSFGVKVLFTSKKTGHKYGKVFVLNLDSEFGLAPYIKQITDSFEVGWWDVDISLLLSDKKEALDLSLNSYLFIKSLPVSKLTSLEGVVKTKKGLLLEGVSIRAEGFDKVKSDSKGYFKLATPPSLESIEVSLCKEGFSTKTLTLDSLHTDIVLDELILKGSVLNYRGLPLAGCSVLYGETQCYTNRQGIFSFNYDPAIKDLTFKDSRYALKTIAVSENHLKRSFQITLEPKDLEGFVFSSITNMPIHKSLVTSQSSKTLTDSQGNFILKGISDRETHVTLKHPCFIENTFSLSDIKDGVYNLKPKDIPLGLMPEGRLKNVSSLYAKSFFYNQFRVKQQTVFKGWSFYIPTDTSLTIKAHCVLTSVKTGQILVESISLLDLDSNSKEIFIKAPKDVSLSAKVSYRLGLWVESDTLAPQTIYSKDLPIGDSFIYEGSFDFDNAVLNEGNVLLLDAFVNL